MNPQLNQEELPSAADAKPVAAEARDLSYASSIRIIENTGQISNPEIRYYTVGGQLGLGFTRSAVAIAVSGTPTAPQKESPALVPGLRPSEFAGTGRTSIPLEMLRIEYVGANAVDPSAERPVDSAVNVFRGNDSANWRVGIRAYEQVIYRDLYPGVDLVYHASPNGVKYDVVVHPGGNLSSFVARYQGAKSVNIDDGGGLVIKTRSGETRDSKVDASDAHGDRVPCRFVIVGPREAGFACDPWDPHADLVVDPLLYSTLLGGNSSDFAGDVAAGPSGEAYVCGWTFSSDFPNQSALSTTLQATTDLFITRINAQGSGLVFSTYVGGNGDDGQQCNIGLDATGDAYVAGGTTSNNFPGTAGHAQPSAGGGGDIFALKLAGNGSQIVFATYYGGTALESAYGSAVDSSGALYIAGYQGSGRIENAAIIKLNASGNAFDYAAWRNGTSYEVPRDIALDPSGNAYAVGCTESSDFPTTPGVIDRVFNGTGIITDICQAGFLFKVDPTGSIVYSTFIDTNNIDNVDGVYADASGNVTVVGDTLGTDLNTTPGAIGPSLRGYSDFFVVTLNANASQILVATYVGGNGSDSNGLSVWVDGLGRVFLGGETTSTDYPTSTDAFARSLAGGWDDVLTVVSPGGDRILYSTLWGGSADDQVIAISGDTSGNVFAVGYTLSSNFSTTNGSFNRTLRGTYDATVTAFAGPGAPRSLSASPGDGAMRLSWTAPADNGSSNLTGYALYRGSSASNMSILVTIGMATNYTDAGLVNGVRYYYGLRAITNLSRGSLSAAVNGTPVGIPTPPLNVTASPGDGSVRLAWSPPASNGTAPLVNYSVYRGTSLPSMTFLRNLSVVSNFTDSNVSNGASYYYAITAWNSLWEGNRSTAANATPAGRPDSPVSLVATPGDARVYLTWTAAASTGGVNLTGFTVYRGTAAGNLTSYALLTSASASFVDNSATNGLTLYYQVSASNYLWEGNRSAEVFALPAGLPSIPLNLTVAPGDAQVKLTWLPPASNGGASLTGYALYRTTDPNSSTVTIIALNATTFTDVGLLNGVTYFYQVAARNYLFEGPRSIVEFASPFTVPAAPVNLTVVPGAANVSVSWSAPPFDGGRPLTWYAVYRGVPAGPLLWIANVTNLTWFVDPALGNGTAICYEVRAGNAAGEGPGPAAQCTTTFDVPGVPLNVRVTERNGSVTIAWSGPVEDGGTPILGYRLYGGSSPSGGLFLPFAGGPLCYNDTGLSNGQTYTYRIAAANVVGDGVLTAPTLATPFSFAEAPSGLAAVGGLRSIALSWGPPPFDGGRVITGYSVYRAAQSGPKVPLPTIGNVTSVADADLSDGATYCYEVHALNLAGEGPASSVRCATTFDFPSAPENLTAHATGAALGLDWSPPTSDGGSAVFQYVIYRRTSAGNESVLAIVVGEVSFVDGDVASGAGYYYQLRAESLVGRGASTREVTPPRLEVVAPLEGALTNSSNITVRGQTERTNVTVMVNGLAATIDLQGNFSVNVPLSLDVNQLEVIATDAAGNTQRVVRDVKVDRTAPWINVQSPVSGALINSAEVDVIGIVEPGAKLIVNDEVVSAPTGAFSRRILLTEGENAIQFVAIDPAGNTGFRTVLVTVDSINPVLTVTTPTNESLVNAGNVVVSGKVEDDHPGTLSVGGADIQINTDHTFSFVATLYEGTNFIALQARDGAGNTVTKVLTVNLDSVAPHLFAVLGGVVATNGDFTSYDSTVSLRGGSEPGSVVAACVASPKRAIHCTAVPLAADGSFVTSLDLDPDARNMVEVRAHDAAGNSAVTRMNVSQSSRPLAATDTGPAASAVAVLLLAAVAGALGGGFVLGRRARSPTEEAPSVDSRAAPCVKCGLPLGKGDQFCRACGASVGETDGTRIF